MSEGSDTRNSDAVETSSTFLGGSLVERKVPPLSNVRFEIKPGH